MKNWLFLAPHLRYPLMNGADISIDRFAKNINILLGHTVTLVGENFMCKIISESECKFVSFENKFNSRLYSALFSLLTLSHYSKVRFITYGYKRFIRKLKIHSNYDYVVCSYVFTLHAFDKYIPGSIPRYVWTHNNDIQWFSNAFRNSNNPIVKCLNYISLKKSMYYLNCTYVSTTFIAVSDNDFKELLDFNNKLSISRFIIGADVLSVPIIKTENDNDDLVLTFIGSLGVSMNIHGLFLFINKFYPILKEAFGQKLVVQIVGSNPSKLVKKVCEENNLNLYANMSDLEIDKLLAATDYTFLSFNYSSGIKLKLLYSLSRGIPVLATNTLYDEKYSKIKLCLFSDNPIDWVDHINKNYKANNLKNRIEIINSVKNLSWLNVTKQFLNSNNFILN